MKTMIRIAAAASVVLFAVVSTQCAPQAYVVHDVYRYHYNDSDESRHYKQTRYSTTNYSNQNYAPYGTPPRSFVPMQSF